MLEEWRLMVSLEKSDPGEGILSRAQFVDEGLRTFAPFYPPPFALFSVSVVSVFLIQAFCVFITWGSICFLMNFIDLLYEYLNWCH